MTTEIELEKLDYATLKKLLDDVSEKIAEKRENELKTLVNGWKLKAEQSGFTIAEVIAELRSYQAAPPAKTSHTSAPAKKTTAVSEDKAGHLPELGATYKNPTTGETWTKTGGRAKNTFVELIAQGKTWAELKV